MESKPTEGAAGSSGMGPSADGSLRKGIKTQDEVYVSAVSWVSTSSQTSYIPKIILEDLAETELREKQDFSLIHRHTT